MLQTGMSTRCQDIANDSVCALGVKVQVPGNHAVQLSRVQRWWVWQSWVMVQSVKQCRHQQRQWCKPAARQ